MKKVFLLLICSKQIFGNAQNVGIGTSNPSRAKLEVHGAADQTSAIFGGETRGLSFITNPPSIGFNMYHKNGYRLMADGTGMLQTYIPNAGVMAFDWMSAGNADQQASVYRIMTLYYNKRVNIGGYGSTVPNSTLEVARGNGVDGTAVFAGTTHSSYFNYNGDENTYIRAGRDNGTVIINDVPGGKICLATKVGIGTANPYYPLEIRQPGSDKGWDLVNANNNVDWEYRVTGSLGWLQTYYNGNYVGRFNQWGVYDNVSDGRLKSNIQALPPLLRKVMQLQPVSYEMIDNNPHRAKAIGFVAQDVKPLFPELVSVTDDTATTYRGLQGLHALNYSGFAVLAIKAIQEQQQLIESLEGKLAALQTAVLEIRKEKTK